MRRGVLLGLVLGVVVGSAGAAAAGDTERDRRLGEALERIAGSGAGLDAVRIEVSDGVNRSPSKLVVYGTGVGTWDRTRQFEFKPKLAQRAVELLHEAGFAELPERAVGPPPDPTSKAGPEVTQVLSSITVAVGDLERTVYQDNKAYRSPELARLIDSVIEVFRKAGQKGVGAKDLDDALAKLEQGTLRPEVLELTANAPQQRELGSQAGQGWLLRIRHGRVEAVLHELGTGYGAPVSRRLTVEEARQVAAWLREARVTGLPTNLLREGYTDLSVGALGFSKAMQARRFAGRDLDEQATERRAFNTLRERLESLCREVHLR